MLEAKAVREQLPTHKARLPSLTKLLNARIDRYSVHKVSFVRVGGNQPRAGSQDFLRASFVAMAPERRHSNEGPGR